MTTQWRMWRCHLLGRGHLDDGDGCLCEHCICKQLGCERRGRSFVATSLLLPALKVHGVFWRNGGSRAPGRDKERFDPSFSAQRTLLENLQMKVAHLKRLLVREKALLAEEKKAKEKNRAMLDQKGCPCLSLVFLFVQGRKAG